MNKFLIKHGPFLIANIFFILAIVAAYNENDVRFYGCLILANLAIITGQIRRINTVLESLFAIDKVFNSIERKQN